MSLSQLVSSNGYIVVESNINVNISSQNEVVFNEFNQASVTISYVPSISRSRTAFLVRAPTGTIAQVSFRNDIVRTAGDTKIQFTGGTANLLIQSNVGRTSNISRGVIGARNRRNTGEFDITVELWSSDSPSSSPNTLVDSLRIRGRITEIFTQEIKVDVIDGPTSSQKQYFISLPESENNFRSFLYGYKFVSIPRYLTIRKGRTTINQGDVVQVNGGGLLEVTSSGTDGSGQIEFTVCGVDLDRMQRNNSNLVQLYDFASFETQSQPLTLSGNDVTPALSSTYRIVVTYPRVSENKRGFLYFNNDKQQVASNDSSSPVLSIWSDSARTIADGYSSEGIIQITLPASLPLGDSKMFWKFRSLSNLPIIKVFAQNGLYDPNNEKGEFISQNQNGLVEGELIVNRNNRSIFFDIKSLKYLYGDFQFTFKLSSGNDMLPVEVSSLPFLNFRLIENPPKSMARDKRIYLSDNSVQYIMDPSFDDSSEWHIGSEENSNTLDSTTDNVYSRIVNFQNNQTRFNMVFGDDGKESNQNFVGQNGDLGLFVDLSTIVTSVYGNDNNNLTENLAFIVNPRTFNTLRNEEKLKNIWKNNVINGNAINGIATAKYQLYTLLNGRYTVTEYTRRFTQSGSISNLNDTSIVLARNLVSLGNYPRARLTAPTANLFNVPSESNSYNFVVTQTGGFDNYFDVNYEIKDNVIIINPCINEPHFYGKVTMTYKINDGTLPSFDTGTSNIYFIPKTSLDFNVERCVFDNDQLVPVKKSSFVINEADIKYRITTRFGSDEDFDYIDGSFNNIPYESNESIKSFLRSIHKINLKYVNSFSSLIFNNESQNQNISRQSFVFNDDLSSFFSEEGISSGYDVINWKLGQSVSVWDFNPVLSTGKYYNTLQLSYFNSFTGENTLSTNLIYTNIWPSQDIKIFGVPVIKAIRTEENISLLNRNDLKTCTTAVVFNDGEEYINVTVMDIMAYNMDQHGEHPVYVNTSSNQHVTIAPNHSRVFLRMMFEPEAWDAMGEDYQHSF